ncbi:MAG: transketolase [Phycisphaerae bacterium]|nr:transketolase [Phycisphaerae bacterium]
MDRAEGIEKLCIDTIRTLAMDAVQQANSGHPGAAIAMAPVAYGLFARYLRFDPAHPDWPDRDRFVLSAGHASMLLYGALHLSGYDLSLEDIKSFRRLHSKTPGHPELGAAPGVETTTGPLGQGAGASVGMAIARKWLADYFNRSNHQLVNYRIFALLGDGCMMEGVTAESASLAGHLGLNNLVWIYDNNEITIDGPTSITYSDDVVRRFEAYGWRVHRVDDVNDFEALCGGLDWAVAESDQPSLLVVDSVIGYGAPTRAGTSKAHGEPLGEDEIAGAKRHYGWDPGKKFFIPEAVHTHMTEPCKARGRDLHAGWAARFEAYARDYPDLADQWQTMQRGELPTAWDKDIPIFEPDRKGLATRTSGGKVLNAIAGRVPWLMGGAADLAASTKTRIADGGDFAKGQWGGRNLNFGVREHAMAAVANGMTLSRLRAYASSFLTFADYCRPSIRLSALMGLPVIYVFTHDSIGVGEDGPTHQPVEHLAALRAIPGLDVYRPCDASETAETWRQALQTTDHPVLLALTRQNLPTLDRGEYGSASGVIRGAYVLADCDGQPDLIILATGSEVHLALRAYKVLTAEGVRVRVVSMPCWEAFERQEPAYRNEVLPPEVKARVAVEAGVPLGWHRYVGSEGAIVALGTFGESAPAGALMEHFGFEVEHLVEVCRKVMSSLKRGSQSPSEAFDGISTMNPVIAKIAKLGQSIWYDNIRRSVLTSGQLQALIDRGVTGVTSNPTIFKKAIADSDDYQADLGRLSEGADGAMEVYEVLAFEDIRRACDLLLPVYERSERRDGFVSIEVHPALADDAAGTIAEAKRIFAAIDRPNAMIKIPATEAGMPAIEATIAEGINVNVTLIFSTAVYHSVIGAYLAGLEQFIAGGGDAASVASVASFFVSRLDTLVDKLLGEKIDAGQSDLSVLLGAAAVANTKLAYRIYKQEFATSRFAALQAKGARVQRPLWASTSTKNPKYHDLLYVDNLIGPDTVNTVPPATLDALCDHGKAELTLEQDLPAARDILWQLEQAGIAMPEVTEQLKVEGVKAFADSFDQLITAIESKLPG